MADGPERAHARNRSGGGVVFGGTSRSAGREPASIVEVVAGLRRRWASGIAVVTATDAAGDYRGVTVTSLMVVSQEPPIFAIALSTSSTFQHLARVDEPLGISLLESTHEFPAERFAGRAPVPDARFTGIRHRVEDGVPILDEALGWCVGRVESRQEHGDHFLVLVKVSRGDLGPDTDDPLLSYEGRYRRLEAG